MEHAAFFYLCTSLLVQFLIIMTTEQVVLKRLHELPDYLHLQVIDYMEYLITKHNISKNEETIVSEDHKKILTLRYEKFKENPHAGDDWEIVKKRFANFLSNTIKADHFVMPNREERNER